MNGPRRFEAYGVALEMIRGLAAVLPRIKSRDGDLAKQGRRAASSVALNLSEGNRRKGKDRAYHFSVAAGSADEVLAVLEVSEAWGYLSPQATGSLKDLLDRVLAMTWKLSHPSG